MLWIYQRGNEDLHIETSFDNQAKEYVLMIKTQGLQNTRVESFKDAAAFQVRLESLEREIESEQWNRVGAPIFLRDGWKVG